MVLFLLFSFNLYAHVVLDDVSVTEKASFSFAKVCQTLVTHESPLIEVVSGTELDCMGKKVSVSEFCEKEQASNPYYLRAYVNKEKKEVVCLSGKKVLFKYLCTKKTDQNLCETNSKMACGFIRTKLAYRLEVVHDSFTKNEKGIKQLNCFFELPSVVK